MLAAASVSPASAHLLSDRAAFYAALQGWFRVHRRPLPWREAPSLYRTVVSEFMLQQTQVATVLPYFARWERALPDFAALAAAPEAEVLKLWEGLGYYSRARRLQRLAQALGERPAPPRTAEEWTALPGVGPYTAAAVASIAFGAPVACVDGNVVRVLARLTAEPRRFASGSVAARHFTPLAQALVPADHPGDHNQAMMELGATVCLRRQPRCAVCPVAAGCAARRQGAPEEFPRLAPRRVEAVSVHRAWLVRAGAVLLRRGPAGERRLAGLHELPTLADLGLTPPGRAPLLVRRRTITRFRITETIHAVTLTPALRRHIARTALLEWIPRRALARVTLSGPHRRWLEELLASGAARPLREIKRGRRLSPD